MLRTNNEYMRIYIEIAHSVVKIFHLLYITQRNKVQLVLCNCDAEFAQIDIATNGGAELKWKIW